MAGAAKRVPQVGVMHKTRLFLPAKIMIVFTASSITESSKKSTFGTLEVFNARMSW